MRRAVYPGAFDPPTNGHLDVIERGSRIFDELIVAVADNPQKKPLFTRKERMALLRGLVGHLRHVRVDTFDGLAVDFVRKRGSNTILRGIRTISDFEFEFSMALTNRKLAPEIETVFVMTHEDYSFISSRLIKEVVSLGANASALVPPSVIRALERSGVGRAAPAARKRSRRRRWRAAPQGRHAPRRST
ncbi:MAG: pantetheine-phosphate adenylyltransferase [Planctomycetes bacterium]|nr:pantetheine-phosphate adenylyltransferase [Planctomycetota bacterium]